MSSNNQPPTCNQYTIGLITALSIELAALTAMLDEIYEYPHGFASKSDDNNYQFGRIASHNVVIASLPTKVHGKVSAATTATQMIASFPDIRFGLLIGIGGGVPNLDLDQDIRLGDVVVAVPGGKVGGVVQYDLGKATAHGFKRTGSLPKPPDGLLKAIQALQARHEREDSKIPLLIEEAFQKHPKLRRSTPGYSFQGAGNDLLFQAEYKHSSGSKCTDCDGSRAIVREERVDPEIPRIHYGLIASGDLVIKNAATRDSVAAMLKKETDADCLCFEMEAAGLMNFPSLVVRGISDYADSHKNDRWQRYSAITAAAFAKELLQMIREREVRAIKSVRQVVEGLDNYVRETGGKIDKTIEEKKLKDVNEWLEAPDPSVNLAKALSLRHPNTGKWLLQGPAFRSFVKLKAQQLIWLHGNSGCGKTCLAASAVKALKLVQEKSPCSSGDTSNIAVLYFFFDFRDSSKQSLDGLLRSFLQQLHGGSLDSPAGKVVFKLLEKWRTDKAPLSTKELVKAFKAAIASFGEVQMVLDALDECPQGSQSRRPILQWITDHFKNSNVESPTLKMIVTSRSDQSDIERRFNPLRTIKSFLSVDSESDICKFVRDRLQQEEFDRWRVRPDIQEKIRMRITEKAGTMFRLAELLLREIETCGSASAVEKALKNLPNDLSEVYVRSLQQVSLFHQRHVLQLLQLMLYPNCAGEISASFNVGDAEGLHFMAIDPEARTPEDAFKEENIMQDYGHLSPIFSSLVTRTKRGLTLAHLSVKDFLLAPATSKRFNFDFSETSSKTNITRLFFLYLTSISPIVETKEDPLYASDSRCLDTNFDKDCFFGQYALLERIVCDLRSFATFEGAEEANQQLISQFFLRRKAACPLLATAGPLYYQDDDVYRYPYSHDIHALVREYLDHGSNRGVHAVALTVCSIHGLENTLKVLLRPQYCADVNSLRTQFIWPPLNVICSRPELLDGNIIALLVKAGASANPPGLGNGGSMLQTLMKSYREKNSNSEILYPARLLELLLAHGMEVNDLNQGKSLLQEVCSVHDALDEDRVGELLLRHGADPNLYKRDESPLGLACTYRSLSLVKRLIDCGADVNSIWFSETPLSGAASRWNDDPVGFYDMMELLYDHGADINHALRRQPAGGIKYEILVAFGAYIAWKKGDNTTFLGVMSGKQPRDSLLFATGHQRSRIVQTLNQNNVYWASTTTDDDYSELADFAREIPYRGREQITTLISILDVVDSWAANDLLVDRWIEFVETLLLLGREEMAKIVLSHMDLRKAFAYALTRSFTCLVLFFLRRGADDQWLKYESYREFSLETALTNKRDQVTLHGIYLSTSRKVEIFQLAREAGVDLSKITALGDEDTRKMIGYVAAPGDPDLSCLGKPTLPRLRSP